MLRLVLLLHLCSGARPQVAATINRTALPTRVRSGVTTCSTPRWNGTHLVASSYAYTTPFKMLVELYFDRPLLPTSYYHNCTANSPYLFKAVPEPFHEIKAFYGKTNVFTTVALRCNDAYVAAQPARNRTKCACDTAKQYSLSAMTFIMMRLDETNTAPVIDLDAAAQRTTAPLAFAAVARHALLSSALPIDTARLNATLATLMGNRTLSVMITPASTAFIAEQNATIATCFAREWNAHDADALYTYFAELAPMRAAQSLSVLRRSRSVLPPNVHVLIPTKLPTSLRRCLSSLHDKADLSFGAVLYHFGIDWKDNATHSAVRTTCTELGLNCVTHEVFARAGDVSSIVNHVFTTIDEKGYFMRFNDDSEMLTRHWNRRAIDSLRREPVDAGMTWLVDLHNLGVQTHSFISSVHRDIFGYYFPAHFKNLYEDDWITGIYRDDLAKPAVVRLQHHAKGIRYQAAMVPKDVLQTSVSQGRVRVARYLARHPQLFYPSSNEQQK